MSISTLFLRGSFAELFYHLNKPMMMCLRVNVQCANCFDLSRNKSDWHFISIFARHNRPLPCIADPFRQHTPTVLFSKANRVAHTHGPNYFDLSRVLLIHHETLFSFFLFPVLQWAQSICFYSGQATFCCHQRCAR